MVFFILKFQVSAFKFMHVSDKSREKYCVAEFKNGNSGEW